MWADTMVLGAEVPFIDEKASGHAPLRPMDEARFEMIYRRTAGNLWSYICKMTGDAAAADDLLQKTFFRFLRADPQVANDDHLRRWLYRTATNLVMDYFRENKRRGKLNEDVAPPSSAASRMDLGHDMMKVFAELKPQERALLWLAHVEESGHAEIAEALGLKTKSIKVLLFRARKKLGEMLKTAGLAP